MKLIKKFAAALAAFMALITLAAFAPACGGDSNNGENNNEGSGSQGGGSGEEGTAEWNEYDGVSVGFVAAEDCPEAKINENKIFADGTLETGKTYYMVTDFVYKPEYDNDGGEMLIAEINVTSAAAVKATVQEAATGRMTEIVSDGKTAITLPYRIPERATEEQKQRVVVQITPLFGCESQVDFSFRSNGAQKGVVKTEKINFPLNIAYTKGLSYTKRTDSDGEYYELTGMGTATGATLNIPYFADGLEVKKIAMNAFKGNAALRKVIIPDSVTSIGMYAFYDCVNLTDVTVPATVDDMDASAFSNCGNFKFITENGGDYLGTDDNPHRYLLRADWRYTDDFEIHSETETVCAGALGGISNTSISIPRNVKSIGSRAFAGSPLTEITVSEGVTYIGDGAFSDCRALTSLYIPASAEKIGNRITADSENLISLEVSASNTKYKSESNCLLSKDGKTLYIGDRAGTVPDGVEYIAEEAFYNYNLIESVTFPASLKTVGSKAFKDCYNLKSVSFSEGATAIGSYAFAFCPVASLNLPSSLIYVGSSAFLKNMLTEINPPEDVTFIGASAFAGDSLKKATVPEGVINLGSSAFAANLTELNYNAVACKDIADESGGFGKNSYGICGNKTVKTVNFGENVTRIPAHLFGRCEEYFDSVDNVSVGKLDFRGDKIRSIGEYAFSWVKKLIALNFPAGVTEIGEGACKGSEIFSVRLPEGLNTVPEDMFTYCNNLREAYIPRTVEKIQKHAFWGDYAGGSSLKSLKVYFGEGSIADRARALTKTNYEAFYSGVKVYLYSETAQETAAEGLDGYWHYDNDKITVW